MGTTGLDERAGGGRQVFGSPAGSAGSPGERVIDLDLAPAVDQPSPAGDGLRRAWRWIRTTRVPVLLLPLLFVPVAGVSVAVTRDWHLRQERPARDEAASLSLLVPGLELSGGSDNRSAHGEGTLLLVNTGSQPIEVSDLRASQEGLTVVGRGGTHRVRPGLYSIEVALTLDCAGRIPPTIDVGMSVRTEDGRQRSLSSPLTVIGTVWANLHGMCRHRTG